MEMDLIGSLFNASNSVSSNSKQTTYQTNSLSEAISPDDATAFLVKAFNEAEEEGGGDDLTWDDLESENLNNSEEDEEEDDNEDNKEEDTANDEVESEDTEDDESENDTQSEDSDEEKGEVLGSYEALKDELNSERETLSDVYTRFFKEVVEPLFRKIEDSNINVSFDTMKLKSNGLIRIELSHRNSDASAEMQIDIFANTVNGEFLGMENSDGEAISTSLDDVSLDDLISILIKVLD